MPRACSKSPRRCTRLPFLSKPVLQTESRVGHELNFKLLAANRDGSNSVPLSFAADSFAELKGVADRKYTLAWVNPTAAATLAHRGNGPFRKKLPLRVIATFPSYDVMGFAVHKSTGIRSFSQIVAERFPLRLSTNVTSREMIAASPTMFTVSAVMKAAGFTLADLKNEAAKSSRYRGRAVPTGVRRFEAARSTRSSMRASRAGDNRRSTTLLPICRSRNKFSGD